VMIHRKSIEAFERRAHGIGWIDATSGLIINLETKPSSPFALSLSKGGPFGRISTESARTVSGARYQCVDC